MSQTSPTLSQLVVTLASNDPTNPSGSNSTFTNTFPFSLELNGKWMISLLSITYEPVVVNQLLFCYISCIYPQITGSFNVNLLWQIAASPVLGTPVTIQQAEPMQWRLISQSLLPSIEITIRDGLGNIPALPTPTIITLLLQRVD